MYLLHATFEAIAFIVLGIGSLALFSPFKIWSQKESQKETFSESSVSKFNTSLVNTVISFFSKQALFFSIVTADIAMIGIVYGGESIFNIPISTFISYFTIAISLSGIAAIYLRYFKSNTIKLIVKLHVPIIGLLLCIGYFLQNSPLDLSYLVSCSTSLVFLWVLIIKWDYDLASKMLYALVFWLIFYFTSLLWILFFNDSISWTTVFMILFLYSVIFFEGVSVEYFKTLREPIRAISLIWLYTSTVAFWIFLFKDGSFWFVIGLLLSLAFNVYVHASFENYPSLVFSTIIPVPLYYFFFGISENFWIFLISSFLITSWLTFFWRIIRTPYRWDEYVFQSVALLVLIGNIIYYGWKVGISGIFEYSILLLLFSFVIFMSYLQIRK